MGHRAGGSSQPIVPVGERSGRQTRTFESIWARFYHTHATGTLRVRAPHGLGSGAGKRPRLVWRRRVGKLMRAGRRFLRFLTARPRRRLGTTPSRIARRRRGSPPGSVRLRLRTPPNHPRAAGSSRDFGSPSRLPGVTATLRETCRLAEATQTKELLGRYVTRTAGDLDHHPHVTRPPMLRAEVCATRARNRIADSCSGHGHPSVQLRPVFRQVVVPKSPD